MDRTNLHLQSYTRPELVGFDELSTGINSLLRTLPLQTGEVPDNMITLRKRDDGSYILSHGQEPRNYVIMRGDKIEIRVERNCLLHQGILDAVSRVPGDSYSSAAAAAFSPPLTVPKPGSEKPSGLPASFLTELDEYQACLPDDRSIPTGTIFTGDPTGLLDSFSKVAEFRHRLNKGEITFDHLPLVTLTNLISQLESRINPFSKNYKAFTGEDPQSDVNLYSSILEGAMINLIDRLDKLEQAGRSVKVILPLNKASLEEFQRSRNQMLVEATELSHRLNHSNDSVDPSKHVHFFYATPDSPSLAALAMKLGPKTAVVDCTSRNAFQNWIHSTFGFGIVMAETIFRDIDNLVVVNLSENSMNPYNTPMFNMIMTYFDSHKGNGKHLVFFSYMDPETFKKNMRPKSTATASGKEVAGPHYSHLPRIYKDLCQFLPIEETTLRDLRTAMSELKAGAALMTTGASSLGEAETAMYAQLRAPTNDLVTNSHSRILWVSTNALVSYMRVLEKMNLGTKIAVINLGEPFGLRNWFHAQNNGINYDVRTAFLQFPTIVLANLDAQSLDPLTGPLILELMCYAANNPSVKLLIAAYMSPDDFKEKVLKLGGIQNTLWPRHNHIEIDLSDFMVDAGQRPAIAVAESSKPAAIKAASPSPPTTTSTTSTSTKSDTTQSTQPVPPPSSVSASKKSAPSGPHFAVTTLDGTTIYLDRNIKTVEELKHAIHIQTGIPPDQMRFLYKGILIEDGEFIQVYIEDNETTPNIKMVKRLR